MTKVLLLKGPDGNTYKGTFSYNGIWLVNAYVNIKTSAWFETQTIGQQWKKYATYTDKEIKETFTILVEREIYLEPSTTITHWD